MIKQYLCVPSSAGLWRKTKRKARSFKRHSAGPPQLKLLLFANVAGQDASVWHWHLPPHPSSPFFLPLPPLLPPSPPSSPPLPVPALSASTAVLLLPATKGGYWGYYGFVRRWRGSTCTVRTSSTEPPAASGLIINKECLPNWQKEPQFRKAKPILLF